MRIFHDPIIFQLNQFGGIARYWKNLEAGLDRKNHIVKNGIFKDNLYSRYIDRFKSYDMPDLSFDIAHSSYYRIPEEKYLGAVPVVVTAYDCMHERFRSGLVKVTHIYAKKRALKFSDAVIAISETTKNDLINFYNLDHKKIFVCPLNIDPIFYAKDADWCPEIPAKLPEKFYLYVGGRKFYKNFRLSVKSVAALEGSSLVIVGGGALSQAENSLLNYYLSGRYVHLGNVDDLSLKWLYANSLALLYPSLFEGFGLPALEAVVSGGRVIAFRGSAIEEVLPKNYRGLCALHDEESYIAKVRALYSQSSEAVSYQVTRSFLDQWQAYDMVDATLNVYRTAQEMFNDK